MDVSSPTLRQTSFPRDAATFLKALHRYILHVEGQCSVLERNIDAVAQANAVYTKLKAVVAGAHYVLRIVLRRTFTYEMPSIYNDHLV
jgi:hypothetical protein